MKEKIIRGPINKGELKELKAGDAVLLSGLIYTARDQAHMRFVRALKKGKSLPLDLKKTILYYCGPAKSPKNKIIGSCGPTTSSRMDEFTQPLLKSGLLAAIGKGSRSKQAVDAFKKYKAVYFITYAGCGALLSKHVKKNTPIAYGELGPEAVHALEVRDFPLIVAIDTKGKNIFKL